MQIEDCKFQIEEWFGPSTQFSIFNLQSPILCRPLPSRAFSSRPTARPATSRSAPRWRDDLNALANGCVVPRAAPSRARESNDCCRSGGCRSRAARSRATCRRGVEQLLPFPGVSESRQRGAERLVAGESNNCCRFRGVSESRQRGAERLVARESNNCCRFRGVSELRQRGAERLVAGRISRSRFAALRFF